MIEFAALIIAYIGAGAALAQTFKKRAPIPQRAMFVITWPYYIVSWAWEYKKEGKGK